ncbi:MAG: site-specific DNA-methyltransferase, partial [Rhodobacteraceae bacterium]|nr:site-specific DNA-methyltransferase [Paracoccaceae bacterium]
MPDKTDSGLELNRLYYGDCLTIMRQLPPASVDLIYLDPPFNSNRDYSAIYKDETGRPLPDQVEAFSDSWALDAVRERAIRNMPVLMREAGVDDDMAEFWRSWPNALRKTQPRLLAYLSYMTERLLPMRGLLKPTGSIYLHCDPTASHYLKLMMDAVFGHGNFLNEVIWHYHTGGASKHWFSKKHDTLFSYARTQNYVFNRIDVPRTEKSLQRAQNPKGARISASDTTKMCPDVWADIPAMNPMAKERLGYATQKPLALLDRIIRASSNEGDLVLDPFCGCATTIEAAHRLNRHWIGIDIAIHAVKRVARVRL